MSTEIETRKTDWPTFRIRDWLEPLDIGRFFESMRPYDEHIRVEEEMVDGKLVIRAELPGIDPDKDVEIAVKDDMLTLHAERQHKESKKTDGGFRSEFRYGSFHRTLALPKGCKASDVTAQYRNGILEVQVPVPKTDTEAHKVAIAKG